MSTLLPLFPLQLVVFPRTQVPLHIFEERYKEMVGSAIRDKSEFGIVLAKEEGIVNAGCTVTVEQVLTRYPDGRLDILTHGARRFEILYVNQEKSYLQAEVEFFDDEPEAAVPDEIRSKAELIFRELTTSKGTGDPMENESLLSFQIAQAVPDLDFQSLMLRSRSELERLQQVTKFLEQHIPRVRHTERMRLLAPTNGFGHKVEGI